MLLDTRFGMLMHALISHRAFAIDSSPIFSKLADTAKMLTGADIRLIFVILATRRASYTRFIAAG